MKLYVFSCRTFMLALLALIVLAPAFSYSVTSALPPNQNVSSGVLSYREWKNSKINDAQMKIKSIKDKLGTDPNTQIKSTGTEAGLSKELEREILTLSLTQDLTISDYFVGYLTRQTSLDAAIKDVAIKLTPDEVAELMAAYAENFFQVKPQALKPNSATDLSQ